MSDDLNGRLQAAEAALSDLNQRLASLEHRKARPHWRRWLVGVAALSTAAFAQLVTFAPDTPAFATDMNGNFTQLKTWLENKVGSVASTGIAVNGDSSINGVLSMSNRVITNVAPPVGNSDVVTKAHLKTLLANSVIFVVGASCPPGFLPYTAAENRFVLGGSTGNQGTGGTANVKVWTVQQQAGGTGNGKTGAVGLSTDTAGPVWSTNAQSDVQNNWVDRVSAPIDIRPPWVVLKPCRFDPAY